MRSNIGDSGSKGHRILMDSPDRLQAVWVKLHGCRCPSYPIWILPSDLPRILAELEPGDAIQIERPLKDPQEGQLVGEASP